jgi:ribosomal protein S18 acetylase RimI-like enzyme
MKITTHIIEPATLADLDQLVVLEQRLFETEEFSRKNLRYLIQRDTVIVERTERERLIIGYAILIGRKNSRKARFYSLGVAESISRTGIGTQLVNTLEEIAAVKNCTSLTLEVSDTNKAALLFYNKCGFRQYGFRYNYYKDGGHALLMRKKLPDSPFLK